MTPLDTTGATPTIELRPTVRALASELDWMTAPDYTPDEWPQAQASLTGAPVVGVEAALASESSGPGPSVAESAPVAAALSARASAPPQTDGPDLTRPGAAAPLARPKTLPTPVTTPPSGSDPSLTSTAGPHAVGPPLHIPSPTPGPGLPRSLPGVRWSGRVSHGIHVLRGHAAREQEARLELARTPLTSCHRVAVIALKGGVAKTSVALGLGTTLAMLRQDRVAALDTNPDGGTLGQRVQTAQGSDVHELLNRLPELRTYMDIRPYVRRTQEGLEVLASGADTDALRILDDRQFRAVMDLLCGAYPVVITDTGTGLFGGGPHAIFDLADQLVLCATPGVDATQSAALVLDWLVAHGRAALAQGAVVVFSELRDAGRVVRVDDLVGYFGGRCRRVCTVPYDEQLAVGGEFRLDLLRSRTRAAFVDVAVAVGEGMHREPQLR